MFLRSTPTRIAVSNFGLPPPSNMKNPYSPLLHEFPCTRLLVNEIHDKACPDSYLSNVTSALSKNSKLSSAVSLDKTKNMQQCLENLTNIPS